MGTIQEKKIKKYWFNNMEHEKWYDQEMKSSTFFMNEYIFNIQSTTSDIYSHFRLKYFELNVNVQYLMVKTSRLTVSEYNRRPPRIPVWRWNRTEVLHVLQIVYVLMLFKSQWYLWSASTLKQTHSTLSCSPFQHARRIRRDAMSFGGSSLTILVNKRDSCLNEFREIGSEKCTNLNKNQRAKIICPEQNHSQSSSQDINFEFSIHPLTIR